MNNRAAMLEEFTNQYAVPVAEAWNDFHRAATAGLKGALSDSEGVPANGGGGLDTGAAYVRYAVALNRAEDARDTLKNSNHFKATKQYEERLRTIAAFEHERAPICEHIDRLQRAQQHERANEVAKQIPELNARINAYAEQIGSDTRRATNDVSAIHSLNYIDKPRLSEYAIPGLYGMPNQLTYADALAYVIERSA